MIIWLITGLILAVFGLPFLACGGILKLCEGRWGRAPNAPSANRMLAIGLLLWSPLLVYFGLGATSFWWL
jgi:hypothetical protein